MMDGLAEIFGAENAAGHIAIEIKNPDGSNFTLNDSSVIQGDEINRKICSSLVKTKYFHYFKKLALSNQAPRMNDFGASSR